MRNLAKQAIHFVGLSGIGWILDFCIYIVFGFFSQNLIVNNIVSSWVGVTFVFAFATGKVFQNNSHISLKWKYLIYILYQCVLIFVISKLLDMVNSAIILVVSIKLILNFSTIISKIMVTPITMIMNFFVMKGIIERI